MMLDILFVYSFFFVFGPKYSLYVPYLLFKILYSIQLESKSYIEKRIASIVYLCL